MNPTDQDDTFFGTTTDEQEYLRRGGWRPAVEALVRWLRLAACHELASRLEREMSCAPPYSPSRTELVTTESIRGVLTCTLGNPPTGLSPDQRKELTALGRAARELVSLRVDMLRPSAQSEVHMTTFRQWQEKEGKKWERGGGAGVRTGTSDEDTEVSAAGRGVVGDATPDGPGERLTFWWNNTPVGFSKAPLRFRLCTALWDRERGRPHGEREEEVVIALLYGSEECGQPEAKLKDVVRNTNVQFEEAGIPLRVKRAGGKLWLEEAPA